MRPIGGLKPTTMEVCMDNMFDDPGDLAFLNEKEHDLEPDEMNDDFHEPYPGEEE